MLRLDQEPADVGATHLHLHTDPKFGVVAASTSTAMSGAVETVIVPLQLRPRTFERDRAGVGEQALIFSGVVFVGSGAGKYPELSPPAVRVLLVSRSAELDAAVNESRSMLGLGEDWDGQGAEGYSESTWQRAIDVLYRFHDWKWSHLGKTAEVPVIGPGPNGSIDLHWKSQWIELLVNVPKDTDAPAEFYGDDYGKFSIKGTFDTGETVEPLARWLVGE